MPRTDKPDVDIYHGHDGLRPFVESWTGMFPDIRVEVVGDSIDLGDQVITPTYVVGTARTTGINLRDPCSFLFKLAGQKIVHVREFHDNAEALKAAGLEE
jgi:ketosteroid isomerase-like protein